MSSKSIGEIISFLRKEKGMTQSELAEKMNVTDKAVSKWERNLSCPDINSIPRLAEILDISTDELLNAQKKNDLNSNRINEILDLILIGIGLAMGVSTIVISILDKIDMHSIITMLGMGLSFMGIYLLRNKDHK